MLEEEQDVTRPDVTYDKQTEKIRRCVKIFDGPYCIEKSGNEIAAPAFAAFIVKY